MMTEGTLCNICDNCENQKIVVFGRELNEEEKKFNARLKRDKEEERCREYGRHFNNSFKKRKYHCEKFIYAYDPCDTEDEW